MNLKTSLLQTAWHPYHNQTESPAYENEVWVSLENTSILLIYIMARVLCTNWPLSLEILFIAAASARKLPICSLPINVLNLSCSLMMLKNLRHLVVCFAEILTRLASCRLSALVLYGSESLPAVTIKTGPQQKWLELLLVIQERIPTVQAVLVFA